MYSSIQWHSNKVIILIALSVRYIFFDVVFRSSTVSVKVTLQDVNDHVPIVEEQFYTVTVTEAAAVNSTILTVKVSGKNVNTITNKQYSCMQGLNWIWNLLLLSFVSISAMHSLVDWWWSCKRLKFSVFCTVCLNVEHKIQRFGLSFILFALNCKPVLDCKFI